MRIFDFSLIFKGKFFTKIIFGK